MMASEVKEIVRRSVQSVEDYSVAGKGAGSAAYMRGPNSKDDDALAAAAFMPESYEDLGESSTISTVMNLRLLGLRYFRVIEYTSSFGLTIDILLAEQRRYILFFEK